MISSPVVYFIGYNSSGEFGLNHAQDWPKLTRSPHKNISKVFSSQNYTIYSNHNFKQIFAAGSNSLGECGIGIPDEQIITLTPITYFNANNINITKICTNVSGNCTYFISDKCDLYGCGSNEKGSFFGIYNDGDDDNQYEPKLINGLTNVIDAYGSYNCSIVLCSTDNAKISIILKNWSRLYAIPHDIITVLLSYTKINAVFSTTTSVDSGHLEDEQLAIPNGWNEVKIFADENINIVGIAMGNNHALFVDDRGVVWSCGINNYGCLGLGIDEKRTAKVYGPREIKYFMENDIRIKDIKCGYEHNLALCMDGNVYSWGLNSSGQCGHDMDGQFSIPIPTKIDAFDDEEVVVIKCGEEHSYICTASGKHYLFGSNGDYECLKEDADEVPEPYRFDEVIKEKYKIKSIIDVDIGYYNTKIIAISE